MFSLLHGALFSTGQEKLRFDSYGVDDGLPQSTIWSIAQDKNGFVWSGTSDGICRFDGYNFNTYHDNRDDTNSVVGGLYHKFYSDGNKKLWIISENGISLYNEGKDNFTRVFSYKEAQLPSGYSFIFGEDHENIWAGISAHGLVKINKQTLKITDIDIPSSLKASLNSLQCGFVSDGKVWMASAYGAVYAYDTHSGKIEKKDDRYFSSLVNLNDSEALGAIGNDLVLIGKRNYYCKSLGNVNALLPKFETITDLHIKEHGDLVLASSKGLFFIDRYTWQVKRKIQSLVQGQSHSYTYIQCLFTDRSGNLWVGTNGDGLKKIAASYKKFQFYSSFSDSGNIVKSIYADGKNLYVGYFNNGLDIFDRKKGFIRNTSIMNVPGIALNHIYAIAPFDSTLLMLNTVGSQFLYTYAPSSGKIRPLTELLRQVLPGFEKKPNINPFLSRQSNIIYAVLFDCLLSFDASDPTGLKPLLVQQFRDERLTCCFRDRKGVLWVGSEKGLFYIEGNTIHQKNSLQESVQVKTINEDKLGNIWVGTVKGIYVLDSSRKQLAHYTERNGLASQFIYGILNDDDGNIWFSHNKGLSKYQSATRSFRHYTREDGLQSNEFNTGAFFKSADGALFFGGINGTNGFYPAEIKDNPNLPATRITSIKLFDEPLKTDSAYWSKRILTLRYDQNTLSFDFAATELTDPKKNKYTYTMQGIDRSWTEQSDKHFARYPALPPGNYIFRVKASNNDGIWQQEATEIYITIVPPIWQTLWFRLLLVLLAISAISSVILLVQRFRDRKKRRAIELQQKIQNERERISRDLHDSVGTQLSLISNNIEWIAYPLKEFTEAERNDKLRYLNQKSRDVIATLRESIWALNKESISIEEFSDKLKSFIQKQLLLYPQISLKYSETVDENLILGPNEALNLFRICQEGISNSLKYAEAANLYVSVSAAGKKYTISIADDGKGFEIENGKNVAGHGLDNMKHRAAEINSTLEISSHTGKGTQFIISKN